MRKGKKDVWGGERNMVLINLVKINKFWSVFEVFEDLIVECFCVGLYCCES